MAWAFVVALERALSCLSKDGMMAGAQRGDTRDIEISRRPPMMASLRIPSTSGGPVTAPLEETPLARVREICLALPRTSESPHFGDSVFRVGKKIFASCGRKQGPWEIVFQLEPAHAAELLASDPRVTPYKRDPRGLVMNVEGVNEWAPIAALLEESYNLIASQKPSRPRTKD